MVAAHDKYVQYEGSEGLHMTRGGSTVVVVECAAKASGVDGVRRSTNVTHAVRFPRGGHVLWTGALVFLPILMIAWGECQDVFSYAVLGRL